MSSQDRLENVLRDIHVMISKSEAYDTDRIIVSKQDIFALIDRLNVSIYEIMDEYELTQQSRDRALRENKKEGDKIIWDASRQAEDIYAASVMYTEEALNHLHVMVEEADDTIGKLYQEFQDNMKQQQETIRENQLELKSQLQLLADTEKYLKLIEERNREIQREREEKKGRKTLDKERHILIKPEIRINEEYFRRAGIPLDRDDEEEEEEDFMEPLEDEGVMEISLKKAEEEQEEAESRKSGVEKEKTKEISKQDSDHQEAQETKEEQAGNKDIAEKKEKEISAKENHTEEAEGKEKDLKENKKGIAAEQDERPVIGKELEEKLKQNLDAEYFKWKSEEQGEAEKQPREKMSLLDKLMGKKKSF